MTPAGAEMTETRVIVACTERQVHWYLGAEPAKCTDPDHQHRLPAPGNRWKSAASAATGAPVQRWPFSPSSPGIPQPTPVAWVRANYCPKAVETVDQEAFITRLRS